MKKAARSQQNPSSHRSFIVLLLILCVIIYVRTLGYGFVDWDDALHLTANPGLGVNAGWKGIVGFWLKPYGQLYIPVTYTFWAIVNRVSGGVFSPIAFRLLNLTFHFLNSVLVFGILCDAFDRLRARGRLISYTPVSYGAFVGAALFAIHPLQVESVAWISSFKDLCFVFFALLSIRSYLKSGDGSGRHRSLGMAFLFFVLALLSKPTAIVLPPIFFAIDRFFGNRSLRKSVAILCSGLAIVAPVMIVTKYVQPDGSIDSLISIGLRPLVALDSIAFYVTKVLFPVSLCLDYGRTPKYVLEQGWLYWTWILPAFLACGGGWTFARIKNYRLGLALAVFPVLPVLGLIPFLFQIFSTVADRYLYLSFLGIGYCAGLLYLQARWQWKNAVFGGLAVILGITSMLQAGTWESDKVLFENALKNNPRSFVGARRIGQMLMEAGNVQEAEPYLLRAIERQPLYSNAVDLLGLAYTKQGKYDQAIALIEPYLRRVPSDVNAHYHLGLSYFKKGRTAEALDQFEGILKVKADDPNITNAIGVAYATMGRIAEAHRLFQQAVARDPGNAEFQNNLKKADDDQRKTSSDGVK